MAQDIRCTIHDSEIPCANCLTGNTPDSKHEAYWEFDADGNAPKPTLRECPLCPNGGQPYFTRTVNGTNMIYVGCSQCGLELKAALIMVTPTKEQPSKDIVAIWNSRASVAAVEGDWLCKCGHPKSQHEFYSDHDECRGCVAREDAENDGLCCGFQHAAASPPAPAEPPPSDLPFDDYCAGGDCRNCKGVNCTCPHHAPNANTESLYATCRRVRVCKRCGNCLDHCKHKDESNFHEDLAMPCSVKTSAEPEGKQDV